MIRLQLILRQKPLHLLKMWPAAGLVDTKIGCFMKPEVRNATQEV
jgi:hypothetical protein